MSNAKMRAFHSTKDQLVDQPGSVADKSGTDFDKTDLIISTNSVDSPLELALSDEQMTLTLNIKDPRVNKISLRIRSKQGDSETASELNISFSELRGPLRKLDEIKPRSDDQEYIAGALKEAAQHPLVQCRRLIQSVNKVKYGESVKRLEFLLQRSDEVDYNELMQPASLQGAINAIEFLTRPPVAIGMDDTGELEVIWNGDRSGTLLTISFLADGTIWYAVSQLRKVITSEIVSATEVERVISEHLL